jgi:hypothetical protein
MPGNGGMRPLQSKRSVPVLMPLQMTSTTQSAAFGGVSANCFTAKRLGSSSTMAVADMLVEKIKGSGSFG